MNRLALLFSCSLSVAAGIAAVGCSGGNDSTNSAQPPAPPSPPPPGGSVAPTLTRSVFMPAPGAPSLANPWDLAFTADGQYLFFTEKCRGLSVRHPNGNVVRLFGTAGSASIADDFFCEGQSGMHGVALDPDFAVNRAVYVYMPSTRSNPRTNRVVRLTVNATVTNVGERVDIVQDISFKNTWLNGDPSGAGAHSGGRIRFGPDRYLYITTGDNHSGPLPQDLSRLGGKVLRVDRNGAAAPGNNTPSGGDPRIFTYGHRNVQGIAFRPGTDQPFVSEHGPGHSDEVTPLVAGGNGGWDPLCTNGINYCGYTSNQANGSPTPMTDTAKFPNAMRPSWNNDGRSQGMGPSTFLSGSQWKAWDGRLAVGIMGGQRLEILELDAAGTGIGTTNLTSAPYNLPAARYRSLVQGPDGSLYIATDAGEIWRVVPN
ncbi:PQQ-dependent sugar dehydrogenase [Betaproteobacteria bacterium PRO7]|jgi:glucose/arabinose dehydrogenase|nr:PQQ-dependent sugar dehydrogenase [Betaproteobacteria bacterium PRO7]